MEQIPIKSKNRCGVYSIFNLVNGKRYVGSSVDIYNRLHEHLHNLRKDIMIKCYIYNIVDWTFIHECESLAEST